MRVTGGTTLYVSGQGAYGPDRQLVGLGDYYTQTKQAFTNVLTALDAVGASYQVSRSGSRAVRVSGFRR